MTDSPRRPLLGGGEQLRRTVRPPRGGPPPRDLFTPEEAAARLRPQVDTLLRRTREIPGGLRGPNIVFRATLQANFLAASHHPSDLLRFSGLHPIGSVEARAELRTGRRSSPDELSKALFLSGQPAAIERVRNLVHTIGQQHGGAWQDVRKLAEVRLSAIDEVIEAAGGDADQPITWEAVLHPPAGETEDERSLESEEVLEKWIDLVRAVAGPGAIRPALRRRIDGLTFIPILAPPSVARTLASFNPLRSLHPMPALRAWSQSVHQLPLEIPPILPPAGQRPQTGVRIAIFDGGIDPHCPLAGPHTRLVPMTAEPEDPGAVRHGHIVTNAVLYGCHEPGDRLPPPVAEIDHFRVLPPESDPDDPFDLELYRTLEHVEDALSGGDYDIATLSLGPQSPLRDGDRPHAWTATLDRLTRRHGVLFVTAVGNVESADDDEPRIRPPADAVNTLAIGACAERNGRIQTCARYSARGPGRHGGRVRPTAVAFGGELPSQPFWGLGPGGLWEKVAGTSYAAPLVTHALAGLAETLGRDRADPATLRAFIVHHAERARAHHRMEELGYGRVPEVLSHLLDCREDSVTVLTQDSIRRNEMGSLLLPMPSGLDPEQWVSLRFTLCFTGPTDAAEAMDYSRAGIQLRLRPHARRYLFRHEDGREEVLDEMLNAEEIEELTEAGFEQASRPKSEPLRYLRSREQEQVRAGKWDTTLSARLRKRAGFFYRPELEIRYLARRRGPLLGGPRVPELRYTLLLTIEAPETPVYEQVQSEYPVLTPIRIRTEVQI